MIQKNKKNHDFFQSSLSTFSKLSSLLSRGSLFPPSDYLTSAGNADDLDANAVEHQNATQHRSRCCCHGEKGVASVDDRPSTPHHCLGTLHPHSHRYCIPDSFFSSPGPRERRTERPAPSNLMKMCRRRRPLPAALQKQNSPFLFILSSLSRSHRSRTLKKPSPRPPEKKKKKATAPSPTSTPPRPRPSRATSSPRGRTRPSPSRRGSTRSAGSSPLSWCSPSPRSPRGTRA